MEIDTGATAWLLTSAALVLLMTPGLAFFYGGMVRAKTVLNMMLMSFGAIGVVGVIWVLWGYSMAFGTDVGGIIGNPFEYFGLSALTDEDTFIAGTPAMVAAAFQATFAIITVALISGAIADRVKFGTWLVFAGIWATLAYFPMAHMVWGGGFLSGSPDGLAAMLFGSSGSGDEAAANVAPIDFAGGTVVHINAGTAGLVLALITGKRHGWGKEPMRPHNLPFVMLGAALLWFGWFGFNAGSAGAADATAGLAFMNTLAAPAAAMVAWMVVEKIRDGASTSLGAASGIVAGLVGITPAAAAVSPVGSIILGLVVGAICAWAVGLKYKFGYDDSLDVVGVHLVGGLVGTILIGFLGTETGLFYGGGVKQLVIQVLIAVIAVVFSGVITAIIGFALKATMGWRIDHDDELQGIDVTRHAETGYDFAGIGGGRSTGSVTAAEPVTAGADTSTAPTTKE